MHAGGRARGRALWGMSPTLRKEWGGLGILGCCELVWTVYAFRLFSGGKSYVDTPSPAPTFRQKTNKASVET